MGALALDHEASAAGRDCAQVHRHAGCVAKNHIAATGLGARKGCADNQVSQAIAVDIARARHAPAAVIVQALAIDHKAAAAGGNRAQVNRHATARAEHHIAAPRAAAAGRVSLRCPDDQVGQAIAVDIARTRHAPAALVARALAVDHKAAVAGSDRAKLDRRQRGGLHSAGQAIGHQHLGQAGVAVVDLVADVVLGQRSLQRPVGAIERPLIAGVAGDHQLVAALAAG